MKLIGVTELKTLGINYCRAQRARLIKQGKFPRPVNLAGAPNSRHVWLEQSILDWLRSRIDQQDAA